MSKSLVKVAASLGIIAGLSVAVLPLSSYAVTTSQNVTVSLTIQGSLGGNDGMECTTASETGAAGALLTGVCNGIWDSNNNITVKIRDQDSNLNLVSGINTIAPIASAVASINSSNPGWGWNFTVTDAGSGSFAAANSNYNPITASDVTAASSTGAVSGAEGSFFFSAWTPATQAPGTYTDVVVVSTTVAD
jgi:hypothetical protein